MSPRSSTYNLSVSISSDSTYLYQKKTNKRIMKTMICMAVVSSCASSRCLQALLQGHASLLLAVHRCGPPADRVIQGAAGLLPLERAGAGSPTLERRARAQVTCWEYFRPEEKGGSVTQPKGISQHRPQLHRHRNRFLTSGGDCWAEEVGKWLTDEGENGATTAVYHCSGPTGKLRFISRNEKTLRKPLNPRLISHSPAFIVQQPFADASCVLV